MLDCRKKIDNISNNYLITLIAKYYYDKSKTVEELISLVKENMLKFNIEGYQEYKYASKIKTICTDIYNNLETDELFKELEYIPIFESELNVVETLENDSQKKFMFTLFVVARYMNCGGWINKKTSKGLSEVFKLANITLSSNKKNEMLNELYYGGYIQFSKKINNLNIHVNLSDGHENIVYRVTSFKNIGNQYIGNFKKGYIQCKCCGKKIKKTNNKKMYCVKCAEKNEKNRKKNNSNLYRN